MLVSKAKPCTSKYILNYEWNREWLSKSVTVPWGLIHFIVKYTDNCGNSRANTCTKSYSHECVRLFSQKPPMFAGNCKHWQSPEQKQPSWSYCLSAMDKPSKCLPYQLAMVLYTATMVITGNGESEFDSGEGAWETATTSKEGSRHANYPLPAWGGSDEK